MSVQAMTWAIEQQDIRDATARHVLLCLANYADADGKAAFPSTSRLEADTGLSESTIRRKLDLLEEMGLIKKGNQAIVAAYIERGDRRPVCYDMVIKKPGVAVTPGDERGVTVTGTGCHGDANGVSLTSERGVTVTPNPSLTINKPSKNRSPKSAEVSLPENFGISDRVRQWAEEKGHGRLQERLDHFVGTAKAKGYRYVDWDQAFMNAIRDDWAKLGNDAALKKQPALAW